MFSSASSSRSLVVFLQDAMSYVPQQAWIQNNTLRNNITFGKKFAESRYERVLDACALRPDLKILSDGDMTEIGEKVQHLAGI